MLVPGNLVQADYRARTEDQLPHLGVELIHSRAFLLSEPLAAAGIEWSTALTAAALPEGQAYPAVYQGLDGLLTAIEAAPSARGWAVALVRFELLVLGELGFGLDEDQLRALPEGEPRPAADHRPPSRPRPAHRPAGRSARRTRAAGRAFEAHERLMLLLRNIGRS